jgi:hypothetical protein
LKTINTLEEKLLKYGFNDYEIPYNIESITEMVDIIQQGIENDIGDNWNNTVQARRIDSILNLLKVLVSEIEDLKRENAKYIICR